ncbi:MAG: hypothetical protein KJ747_05295, partial [Actinobacteria bacterium]|nr:hypothetical protein [Actinomycetota bacterium]MCG2806898.1 deaminase [Coriobacteriia bacterium]
VIQAAKHGIAMDGATAYCTHQPCVLCAKILLNAGVVDIAYRDPYPDPLSAELLAEAGLIPRRLAPPSQGVTPPVDGGDS